MGGGPVSRTVRATSEFFGPDRAATNPLFRDVYRRRRGGTTDDSVLTAADIVGFVVKELRPDGMPGGHGTITAGQPHRRGELTRAECSGIVDGVSTSLGEASTRIQATDPERRETPRVRTAPPGLRVEPKWLPACILSRPDTACSAETLTSGVRASRACFGFCIPACV